MLVEAIGEKPLDSLHDSSMEFATPIMEQAPIGHVVRQEHA